MKLEIRNKSHFKLQNFIKNELKDPIIFKEIGLCVKAILSSTGVEYKNVQDTVMLPSRNFSCFIVGVVSSLAGN